MSCLRGQCTDSRPVCLCACDLGQFGTNLDLICCGHSETSINECHEGKLPLFPTDVSWCWWTDLAMIVLMGSFSND